MENAKIHHIDDKQFIFKLHLPNHHRIFYIKFSQNFNLKKFNRNNIIVKNDNLIVLDRSSTNDSQIFLEIPNYNNESSIAHMYPKNETGEKLALDCGKWIKDINIDGYKNELNEILFHVVKL